MDGNSITSLFEKEGWLGVDVAAGVGVKAAVGWTGVGDGSVEENSPHASKANVVKSMVITLGRFLLNMVAAPFIF
jgi:hypothetical protein